MSARRRATYQEPIRPDYTPESIHVAPVVAAVIAVVFLAAVAVSLALVAVVMSR